MEQQSTNTAPETGRERFTLGLMADVFAVLEQHGYRKAGGAVIATMGVLLTLVETYEGRRA